MPIDHSIELKKSIVVYLRGLPAVSSLVSDRVYGMKAPTPVVWPFIKYGSPDSSGFEATCWDGSEHRVTLHAFAKGSDESMAMRIAKAVQVAMDDFTMYNLMVIDCQWVNTQVIRDSDEADGYHAICQFSVVTAEDVG